MTFLSRFCAIALILPLCLTPQTASAWGNDGHILVNRTAAQAMPATMPLFLRQATARIAYLGPEPDRWRSRTEFELKQAQEPDHFLNYERLQGFGDLPPGRYDFYKRAYERYFAAQKAATTDAERKEAEELRPDSIGLQPYIVMEVYGRLKAALREYRKLKLAHQPTQGAETAAIFYAGWLGHYVADGSQPLHCTIYYDGWSGANPNGYTTAHGIHSLFESKYVAANLPRLQIRDRMRAPVRLEHPFQDYMQYLHDSNGLVEKVYQLEKAGGFKDQGSADALEFTRARLAAGSQMLLNLWYTAWLESADLKAGEYRPDKSEPASRPANPTPKKPE
jgi:hypothetical protein